MGPRNLPDNAVCGQSSPLPENNRLTHFAATTPVKEAKETPVAPVAAEVEQRFETVSLRNSGGGVYLGKHSEIWHRSCNTIIVFPCQQASNYGADIDKGGSTMTPKPIQEIAPPAWPLPLISSLPRGPRRAA